MSHQLPDVNLWMVQRNLKMVPTYSFPADYKMRYYREGDISKWVNIQQSADPFFVATTETFARSMPGDTNFLSQRVMFLVDPAGRDIGSITAWEKDDFHFENFEGVAVGQVHWVAIASENQGKGLAQPMLSACCQKMIAFGYKYACLSTNTKRIPALNLYRKFGFEPILQNDAQKEAWNEILPKLKYEENK